MSQETRQISPDGAYWWDGQAWQPMPSPANPAPIGPTNPQEARPAWLAEGAELPGQPLPGPPPVNAAVTPEAYLEPAPPPAWTQLQPSQPSRSPILLAGAALLVLVVAGGGIYAFQSLNRQAADTSSANPPASAAPSTTALPSTAPPVALPLTAQLGGDYCPVAHPNDSACWKGSLLNTGPAIHKLALMFVIGGGYDDWFAHHANGTLSGFYTTAGCDVDAVNHQIVCGNVAPGGQVDVYLGGDVTTRGTFHYAIKFADISTGSPVYVNQHPNGTHDVVSWTEVIT
jgi:hypothetical protein